VVPVLGPQRENFGAPEQVTGRQQNPRGAKQALDLASAEKDGLKTAESLNPKKLLLSSL
jgi:hypothetical protein